MPSSWKTSAAGLCGALAVILHAGQQLLDGDPTTNPDWGLVVAAIFAAIAALNARDNKTSDEQAGAGVTPEPEPPDQGRDEKGRYI